MKKAFWILLTVSALYLSTDTFAQETTKPDTVKIDKNKDQVLPPKSEATDEAPKKAEVRDSSAKDTIPKIKIPKTDKRREAKNRKKTFY